MRYNLGEQAITDATLLEKLYELHDCTELVLFGNDISQFPAKELPAEMRKRLKVLDLQVTEISDLSFLEYLPGLTELYLSDTEVNDLTPLQYCPHLTKLYLTSTPVKDIRSVGQLCKLKELSLSDTQIGANLLPLKLLVALEKLYISNVEQINAQSLFDLESLSQLHELQVDPELQSTRDAVLRNIVIERSRQLQMTQDTFPKSFEMFTEEISQLINTNRFLAMECLEILFQRITVEPLEFVEYHQQHEATVSKIDLVSVPSSPLKSQNTL